MAYSLNNLNNYKRYTYPVELEKSPSSLIRYELFKGLQKISIIKNGELAFKTNPPRSY